MILIIYFLHCVELHKRVYHIFLKELQNLNSSKVYNSVQAYFDCSKFGNIVIKISHEGFK